MGSDTSDAFRTAAASISEVTRLEAVRYHSSAQNWEQLLAGLATVVGSAGRLADCLADRLAKATAEAAARTGPPLEGDYPDQQLSTAAMSVQQVSGRLAELSGLIAVSRGEVARLRSAPHGGSAQGYPRAMTEHPEDHEQPNQQEDDYEDQDAEPTMMAPEEGRPDGTVAPDRASDDSTGTTSGTETR